MDIPSTSLLGGRPVQPLEATTAIPAEQTERPSPANRESVPFSQVMEQTGYTRNDRHGFSAAGALNLAPENETQRLDRNLAAQNLQQIAQTMIRQSIQNVGTSQMPVSTLSYAGEIASQTVATGAMLPLPDYSPSRKESEWESLRPIEGPGRAEGSAPL